jgi:signal transduction histidine kinase
MSFHEDDSGNPRPDMLTFLASSVHDMKNSVSMLIGGMQKILADSDPMTFPNHGDLMQMTYEARRINSNLVQLLTLYKLGEHLYPFDPQEIAAHGFLAHVAEQAGVLLKARNVRLEVDAASDLYWYFDEDLVGNVIGNAFSNAVRYTRDQVRLSARVEDGMFEIRIEDNGRGYTPEMLEQGRMASRPVDFEGGSTGLGLYFSAVIARLHRNRGRCGELLLENGGTLGGGCFILRLP